MFFKSKIKSLDEKVEEMSVRIKKLECTHPDKKLVFKEYCHTTLTGDFHRYWHIQCSICGKIIKTFHTKRDWLYAQLERIQNQIVEEES
jgi:RNase P subunit RPR2